MEDGDEVPLERTATPVELDQVYGALDELSAALGPDGANAERRAVRPRRRRRGQPRRQRRGAQPHADRLLAGGGDPGDEPGGPVRLAGQPADLHHARWPPSTPRSAQFNDNMAAVAELLAGEREDLGRGGPAARRRRSPTSPGFVQDNSDLLIDQRGPARRRDPRPGPAAVGAGRGPRRRAGRAGQPGARLQPRLRDAGHPRQRRSGPRTPRSSSAGRSPSSGRLELPRGLDPADPLTPAAAADHDRRRSAPGCCPGTPNADGEPRRPERQRRPRLRGAARGAAAAAPAAAARAGAPGRVCPPIPGGRRMTAPTRRIAALGRRRAAAQRLRLPRRVLVRPARRRRRRRRPVHGRRWSSSTCSTWSSSPPSGSPTCRSAGSRRSSSTRTTGPRGSPSSSTATWSCPPTRSPRSSSPRCSARSTSSWPRRATSEPAGRPARTAPLIPLERTNRNVEVEELLGALSLVLNGGGLAQLQTINRELGEALEGREAELQEHARPARHLHRRAGRAEGGDQPGAGQRRPRWPRRWPPAPRRSRRRWTRIGPGLDVINQQRDLLVSMLESLARLGDVGTRVINQSAENTVADLRAAAADPHPAGRRRPGPGRLAGAAAHLPVPGQLADAP